VYQLAPRIPTDETVPLSIPDPLNPRYSYAGGKIISELLAVNYGRKHFDRVVIFRPHNVYGPDMGTEHVIPQFILRMNELARRTEGVIQFPIQGSGNETRAFIFVDDFTDGLIRVIDRGEHLHIYHIGTEAEIRIADVVHAVAGYFHREAAVVPGEPAPGGTPRRCPDITKLRGLGFEPRVPFAEGLARTAAWYVAHAGQG
jgi:nucleoside-diphosphate-sugar epimerase